MRAPKLYILTSSKHEGSALFVAESKRRAERDGVGLHASLLMGAPALAEVMPSLLKEPGTGRFLTDDEIANLARIVKAWQQEPAPGVH